MHTEYLLLPPVLQGCTGVEAKTRVVKAAAGVLLSKIAMPGCSNLLRAGSALTTYLTY